MKETVTRGICTRPYPSEVSPSALQLRAWRRLQRSLQRPLSTNCWQWPLEGCRSMTTGKNKQLPQQQVPFHIDTPHRRRPPPLPTHTPIPLLTPNTRTPKNPILTISFSRDFAASSRDCNVVANRARADSAAALHQTVAKEQVTHRKSTPPQGRTSTPPHPQTRALTIRRQAETATLHSRAATGQSSQLGPVQPTARKTLSQRPAPLHTHINISSPRPGRPTPLKMTSVA